MFVKILSSSGDFAGIGYNTDKIDKDKGELMKIANFGPSFSIGRTRPEDFKNYLKMVSSLNKSVKQPQFHATISVEGRTYDKQALTLIAKQWLELMGYGAQPYLIVFHKDTANNHVHIVSTRIDRQGKKINSGFENIRAMQNLNKVLGMDEKHSAQQDIDKALSYRFSTKAQFMMILECRGYHLQETDGVFEVIKFGVKQGEVSLKAVEDKIKNHQPDQDRKAQLKAIFHKYVGHYDTALSQNSQHDSKAFTSEFSAMLRQKFGIALIFHASGDKPPYGYTVIDHSGLSVFKGGEIMPLKQMLETITVKKETEPVINPARSISFKTKIYYAAIVKAAMYNYPDLIQGLHHQGLNLVLQGDDYLIYDQATQTAYHTKDLLTENSHAHLVAQFRQLTEQSPDAGMQHNQLPQIFIASDIDDEAIHGRNRNRKKKGRTNTR